jgi:hypothetical protein
MMNDDEFIQNTKKVLTLIQETIQNTNKKLPLGFLLWTPENVDREDEDI